MKKIVVLGILATVFLAGCSQSKQTGDLGNFAKCLSNNGAIMYGSVTCSHCQDQKAMFGTSFQYVNYVECTKDFARCSQLKGVPTWEFKDGTQLEGTQELSTLADKTNCTLP